MWFSWFVFQLIWFGWLCLVGFVLAGAGLAGFGFGWFWLGLGLGLGFWVWCMADVFGLWV